jgi:hypothetical protein
MGSVRAIPRGMPAGDPGFFGDLWGGIKGAVGGLVTGGPLGAVGGAVTGFMGGSKTGPSATSAAPPLPPMRTLQEQVRFQQNGTRPPTMRERVEMTLPGGRSGTEGLTEEQRRAGRASSPGYHWNKSGYYLKGGSYIWPGTKEVRNRRMNPLNPSAVKKSMTRLGRAKTAAKDINRVTIRAKACAHK